MKQPSGQPRFASGIVEVALDPASALALAEEVVQSKEVLKSNLAAVHITSRDATGFRYQVMVWYRGTMIRGNAGSVSVTPAGPGHSRVRFSERPTRKLYLLSLFVVPPVLVGILDPSPNSWILFLASGLMVLIIWLVTRSVAKKSSVMSLTFERWARSRRAPVAPTPAAASPFEQLRSLARLHESGVITEAHFEQGRAAILARLQ